MLNITRTWNAVTACAGMRRGIALARDYARRRVAFGAALSEKPLHVDTLAGLQAEFEGAFHLAFFVTELIGRLESGELDEHEQQLLRVATPVAKLTTAKQCVSVVSEVLESFGGAGYVEDTGLPQLLRDVQVLPIWEGTTNVLALDTLRAVSKGSALDALVAEVASCTQGVTDDGLAQAGAVARRGAERAAEWAAGAMREGQEALEAGARRFALTLGRSLELALVVRHAQWSLDVEGDRRARAAALRLSAHGVDQLGAYNLDDSRRLGNDVP
jgi:hypothetical protein